MEFALILHRCVSFWACFNELNVHVPALKKLQAWRALRWVWNFDNSEIFIRFLIYLCISVCIVVWMNLAIDVGVIVVPFCHFLLHCWFVKECSMFFSLGFYSKSLLKVRRVPYFLQLCSQPGDRISPRPPRCQNTFWVGNLATIVHSSPLNLGITLSEISTTSESHSHSS